MARFTARVALVAVFLTAVAASASAQSIYQSLKSGGMSFATGASSPATERMRITQSGLVGVGTSAPSSTLHISTANNSGLTVQNTSTAQNYIAPVYLRGPDSLGNAAITALSQGNNNAGATQSYFAISKYNNAYLWQSNLAVYDYTSDYWRFSTAGAARLTIDSSGNVGIGTTSPTARVHTVAADENTLGILVGNSTYSSSTYNGFGVQVNNAGKTLFRGGWGNAKDIIINDNGGNVGIGIASPNTSLTVVGEVQVSNSGLACSSGTAGAIRYSSGNLAYCNGTAFTTLGAGSGGGPTNQEDHIVSGTDKVYVNGITHTISFTTNGSVANYFNSSGYLVTSGVSATGTLSATTLYSSGDVNFVGTMNDLSDRRAKTDITPLPDDMLARILKLRPISFRMKSGGGLENGFIAQEVQPLFPELVKDGPLLSLNYLGLISPIVKAMQQMQAANDNLRAANDTFAARLDMLELENKSLRARLYTLAGEFAEIRHAARSRR